MPLALPPPEPEPIMSRPIDDPERDAAHEEILLRTRDLAQRIARADPTSRLGSFRQRVRDSLAELRITGEPDPA